MTSKEIRDWWLGLDSRNRVIERPEGYVELYYLPEGSRYSGLIKSCAYVSGDTYAAWQKAYEQAYEQISK